MPLYSPEEVRKDGKRKCGLTLTVEAQGERFEVMETNFDDSQAARVLDPSGEGIHVPNGNTTDVMRITRVASTLACDQCGLCASDLSIELQAGRVVDGDQVAAVEAQFAETAFDLTDIRSMAARCVEGVPPVAMHPPTE